MPIFTSHFSFALFWCALPHDQHIPTTKTEKRHKPVCKNQIWKSQPTSPLRFIKREDKLPNQKKMNIIDWLSVLLPKIFVLRNQTPVSCWMLPRPHYVCITCTMKPAPSPLPQHRSPHRGRKQGRQLFYLINKGVFYVLVIDK